MLPREGENRDGRLFGISCVSSSVTIYEERIIVFYGLAIPAIRVTLSVKLLQTQKGASKHSH